MFRKLYLLAFALMGSAFAFAQPCSSYFVTTGTGVSEVCSVTGAAMYSMSISATSDSTIAIYNVWEGQGWINADVTCMPPQFTFSMQQVYPGYLAQGSGSLQNGTDLSFNYSVFNANDSSLLESCQSVLVVLDLDSRQQAGLSIAPNPTSGYCRLSLEGYESTEACAYQVSDITGRQLLGGIYLPGQPLELDLSSWDAGLYWVQLRQDGRTVAHRTLVKH